MDSWSVEQVCFFLQCVGHDYLVPIFRTNQIDGKKLYNLTPEQLKSYGLTDRSVKFFFDRVHSKLPSSSSKNV